MSCIEKTIKFKGSKTSKELNALFDSGATYSCINNHIAGQLEVPTRLPDILEMETAGNNNTIKVSYAVRLDFYINNSRFSDEFMMIDNLSEEVIIGASTLQKWRFKLDFEQDEVIFDPEVTKLRLI
jgi:hypothetical protein